MPARVEDDEDDGEETVESSAISYADAPVWEKSLLMQGALMFTWIIGIQVLIKLLEKFKTALQPLVLAMVFVSVLETVVQFFESYLHGVCVSVRLLLRKLILIGRITLWSIHNRFLRVLKGDGFKEEMACFWAYSESDRSELCDWSRCPYRFRRCGRCPYTFTPRWDASLAGRDTVARPVAVIITLIIVVFGFSIAFGEVASSMATLGTRIDEYQTHIQDCVNYVARHAQDIPDKIPMLNEDQRDEMRQSIGNMGNSFSSSKTIAKFRDTLTAFASNFASETSSLISALLFFILYVSLVLFDPLHINDDEDAAEKLDKAILFVKENKKQKRRSSASLTDNGFFRTMRKSVSGMRAPQPAPKKMLSKSVTQEWKEVTDKGGAKRELQSHLHNIMWKYVSLKVACNFLYGICVIALLHAFNVEMAVLIGIAGFFLSFIPELGAIVSLALPIPIVLVQPTISLDKNLRPDAEDPFKDFGFRGQTLVAVMVGMLVIKFLVSNIIESVVMSRNKVLSGAVDEGDKIKETHPVIILFAVVISGEIWGVVGMLISVPFISLIRVAANIFSLEEDGENHDD